jgi:acetyltransferase-like isoleucine patch superfamily enzyme
MDLSGLAAPVRRKIWAIIHRLSPMLLSAARRRWLIAVNEPGAIRFDGRVFLGPGLRVNISPGARLVIGPDVELRHRVTLEVGGTLEIGARSVLTYGVVVQCEERITIGSDCMIGTYCSIVDANHRFRETGSQLEWQHLETRPITIGDEVLVNTKATVAGDVGDRAVIAAHGVVVDPIPPRTLAGGLPARELARLDDPRPRGGTGTDPHPETSSARE